MTSPALFGEDEGAGVAARPLEFPHVDTRPSVSLRPVLCARHPTSHGSASHSRAADDARFVEHFTSTASLVVVRFQNTLFRIQEVGLGLAASVVSSTPVGAWPNVSYPDWAAVAGPLLNVTNANRLAAITLLRLDQEAQWIDWWSANAPPGTPYGGRSLTSIVNGSLVPGYNNSGQPYVGPIVQAVPASLIGSELEPKACFLHNPVKHAHIDISSTS